MREVFYYSEFIVSPRSQIVFVPTKIYVLTECLSNVSVVLVNRKVQSIIRYIRCAHASVSFDSVSSSSHNSVRYRIILSICQWNWTVPCRMLSLFLHARRSCCSSTFFNVTGPTKGDYEHENWRDSFAAAGRSELKGTIVAFTFVYHSWQNIIHELAVIEDDLRDIIAMPQLANFIGGCCLITPIDMTQNIGGVYLQIPRKAMRKYAWIRLHGYHI